MSEVGKINSIVPDNTRFSINMHYQSDTTKEFATFRINKAMTVEDVLGLYSRLCPIECQIFLQEVELANKSLHRPGGMSSAGIIMTLGKVPSIVLMMMEFLDPEFFDGAEKLKNFRRFIRAYPKFSTGDHKRKLNTGVIIK